MKIQIENNHGIKVMVESPHDTSLLKIAKISEKLRDIMTDIYVAELTSDTESNASVAEPVSVPVTAPVSSLDRDVIRPRIPNNVVDINELTIEKAVTENALVRCPKCGQAHCLAVPSNGRIYMMRRNYLKNEFGMIADFSSLDSQELLNACCKESTDRQAYFNDLQAIPFRDEVDFAVDNNTEVFCPVCCTSSTFNLWKDAFENPLDYFETEQLCDACGGEKLEKLIKKHKVYQCDKCGLQTDYKEE